MSIIVYNAGTWVRKAELEAALSTRLHQSLNGECTFDLTVPGTMLPGIALGDRVRWDPLYFTVSRIQKNSQMAGALFNVTCEHISYLLNDLTMPAGTYSGSVSSVLGTILAGTPLSVGDVDVSGSFEIVVKSGANRRQVMQQWATITGAEISYTYTMVNFRVHVGDSTPVELSDVENVKSLSIQMDSQSDSTNYSIELSRLQNLRLGDAVHIQYSTLEVNENTRVIALDYDVFHPWNISIQCGDYVPTYYEQVNDDFDGYDEIVDEKIEETKEEILDEVTEDIIPTELELALIRAKEMNFADWDNGSFYEVLDNDVRIDYTVMFDDQDRPIMIIDSSHVCEIVW